VGRVSRSVVLVAALAATAACATRAPSIAQLKVESARYHGRTVSVEGVVTSAWGVPLLPLKFYKIDDRSGEIAVLANSGVVPSRGARVRVTGKVSEVAVLGGQPLGLHLQQSKLKMLGPR